MYTSINQTQTHNSFLIKACIIVGSGGLIFGYDIGVISGTLEKLKSYFNLNDFEIGLVVSILYAGSIFGSIIGGPLCDYFGRWKTIQLQNLIFLLGALLTGLANNLIILCIGRFLVGVASAVSGLADVPYLTEIAPAQYRGIISGQYEILVGAGIMLSFVLDLLFSTIGDGWRIAFVLPGIFAACQSLGMLLLPESPKWLISKGYLEEAKIALIDIYGEYYFLRQLDSAFQIGVDEDIDSSSHFEQITSPVNPMSLSGLRSPSHDPLVDDRDSLGGSPDSMHSTPHKRRGSKHTHSIEHEDMPQDIQDYFEKVRQQKLQQEEEGLGIAGMGGNGSYGNFYDDDYTPSSSMFSSFNKRLQGNGSGKYLFRQGSNKNGSSLRTSNSANKLNISPNKKRANSEADEMKSSLMSDHSAHHSYSTDANNGTVGGNSTNVIANTHMNSSKVHMPRTNSSSGISPTKSSSNNLPYNNSSNNIRRISSTRSISVSSLSEFLSQESDVLHSYRYVIGIVLVIQTLSQITGANVIRNYAPTIFEESGVSTHLALVYNAILGVIKLIFTVIAVVYVEHGGRRTFLLYGIVIVTIGMVFLAGMSLLSPTGNIEDPILFLVGCGLVYAGFGIGYGPAPWILSSEMVPTSIRGRIMSLSLIASNVAQLIMNFIFLPMTDAITTSGSFSVFVVLNLIAFAYAYLYLVETKEVLPHEILTRSLKRRDEACSMAAGQGCCCCSFCRTTQEDREGGEKTSEDALYHSVAYNLIDEEIQRKDGHIVKDDKIESVVNPIANVN